MARIDLTYYTGNNSYTEGKQVEQDIFNYVSNKNPEQYASIFDEDDRWTVFYHLTDMRKALLSWYPFEENGTLLEIGAGMGALTGFLCKKCRHVTAVELSELRAKAIYKRHQSIPNLNIFVGNVLEIPFQEKFDYITLIGVLEYQGNYLNSDRPYIDFLQKVGRLLKPGGKLLIAIENKYGIKYWCGTPEDHTGVLFDGINQYRNGGEARTFDKFELENMLKQSGYLQQRFYYPMPDYKLPQMIFSDNGLPTAEMPHRVIPYSLFYPTFIAKEKELYSDLLKNKVFGFFANSFLVECGGPAASLSEVKTVSITADRRSTHQMTTSILENGMVHKAPLSSRGVKLLAESYRNLMILKKRGLAVVETVLDGDKLTMPFIAGPSMESALLECLSSNDTDGFFHILDQLYEDILRSSDKAELEENVLFNTGKSFGLDLHDYGPILRIAYIDMIPHNCFVVNGENVYFDQEFTEENFPARFMLYRSCKNLYAFHKWAEDIIPLERLKVQYGLIALWKLFEETDRKLLDKLTEKGVSKHLCRYWYVDDCVLKENADLLKNKADLFQRLTNLEADNKFLTDKVQSLQNDLQMYEDKYKKQLQSMQQHFHKIISVKEGEKDSYREKYEAVNFNLKAFERAKVTETKLLRQALQSSESQTKFYQDKYNAIKNATIWKLTKSVRKIKDFLTGAADYEEAGFQKEPPLLSEEQLQAVKFRPCPESHLANRLMVGELVDKLSPYEVISFDVFDTLIFRQFSDPADIFTIIGLKLGILSFRKMRIAAECEARLKSTKKNKEINIFDIYMELGKYLSIDIDKTIELEFHTELDYLYANPYMLSCYKQCIDSKTIIFISDMYWPKDYILRMLDHCGYKIFKDGYISCEYECNKGGGGLQRIVKTLFDGKKIIHIGDNYQGDVEGSQLGGLDTFYYENCNKIGNPCRPDGFDSLTASLYKSIVNCHLHNGMHTYSKDYEHGFIYGGILSCGFCEWLNEYCENTNTEKILFLARDCDIISKVYHAYYQKIDNDYIITSRFAMFQLVFDENPEEFIRYFFKNRANLGSQTIQEALEETDLSFLVEKLAVSGIDRNAILTNMNYEAVRAFIYDNKLSIVQSFKKAKDAAVLYFTAAIGKAKKVCVADLGWGGTILVFMRQFINKYVSPSCDITGTYIGVASNSDTNSYVASKVIVPYLFSYSYNRDIRIITDSEKGMACATMIEALFTSSVATLLKYSLTEKNEVTFIYDCHTSENEQIKVMHQGILEFARLYTFAVARDRKYFKLSPVEAFEPFNLIKYDFSYNYNVFKETRVFEFPLARISKNQATVTLGEIMIKKGLI